MPINKTVDSAPIAAGQQNTKMPSINSGGRQAEPVAAVVLDLEAGTGENAGPLGDWGFLNDELALGSRGAQHDDSGSSGLGGPYREDGAEYSDDEFEPSEGELAAQKKDAKHKGKSHGKKKKKKQQHDDGQNNDKVTPRQQFSLPPI